MATGKTRKTLRNKAPVGNSKKANVSEVVVEKNKVDNSETGVSVFTKTTSPKVIIQSEKVDNSVSFGGQSICGHRFLKSICLVILAIVLLMIFFLTLKTYNTVNELYLSLTN